MSVAALANASDCSLSKQFVLRHQQALSGTFLDPNGQVLPGIEAQLLSGGKVVQEIRTNREGAYNFGKVKAGRYQVRIQYSDHAFCAPKIQCNASACSIKPELAINPKKGVLVR